MFAYRGGDWFAHGLIARLTPNRDWATRAFLAGMVAAGVAVGRTAPRAIFLVYLVLLVAVSPTIANQHLAIPLVACAVHWRNPFAWAYVGVATLALLASPDNVGALPAMQTIAARLTALGFALAAGTHSAPWPQLCLLLFLGLVADRVARRAPRCWRGTAHPAQVSGAVSPAPGSATDWAGCRLRLSAVGTVGYPDLPRVA